MLRTALMSATVISPSPFTSLLNVTHVVNGQRIEPIDQVFVDNLISIIDEAVEKTDDYEKSICEEYGIITKTELCESDTGQPNP